MQRAKIDKLDIFKHLDNFQFFNEVLPFIKNNFRFIELTIIW